MNDTQLSKLSDRQRQCLRLVAQGYEAKDIARELGIGVDTVKQHLRAARQTLGISRSKEAARHLVASEDTPPPRVSPPKGMVDQDYIGSIARSQFEDGRGASSIDRDIGDFPLIDQVSASPIPLPFPLKKGQRNDLSISARLAVMVALTVLLILAVGFLAQASRGLS